MQAAGGSWSTWKQNPKLFLNCSIEIKKWYCSNSLSFPPLCGTPSSIALSRAREDDKRFPLCVGCSALWAMLRFSGRNGLVCHTQLVFRCTSCARTIPHTHLSYTCGWGVGDLIPTGGWSCQVADLPQLHRMSSPGKVMEKPWARVYFLPMSCFFRAGRLHCSSGLCDLKELDFGPLALLNMQLTTMWP